MVIEGVEISEQQAAILRVAVKRFLRHQIRAIEDGGRITMSLRPTCELLELVSVDPLKKYDAHLIKEACALLSPSD